MSKALRGNLPSAALLRSEKALQINYTYDYIRKWLEHFRTLDYSKTKNRKDLIDTFIYRVLLYDDKMKVLFNLKSEQQNELLLNLIFPDYPDGNDGENENSVKEKEVDISTSNSDVNAGCAYTPVMSIMNKKDFFLSKKWYSHIAGIL